MAQTLKTVSLDDKYALEQGRIYITGTQALARLPLVQKRRDQKAGLNTAGYVSGYRGSPLGGLDMALWQAQRFTEAGDIVVRPGVNEELSATAIWGTQQVNALDGARYDGVFSLWYGKGPGVDRSGDVFKHGNAAGSSPHGGVLLVAGDDHAAKSSTLPHQSDYAFMDAGVPVLAPSGAHEFAEFGVLGWAMSRFSGCWVGFKAVTAAIESSVSVEAATAHEMSIILPDDVEIPPGGVHVRLSDDWWEPEARLYRYKLPLAGAFARANGIDRIVLDGGNNPVLGILTTGKAYLDVMEALDCLGIDGEGAAVLGVRVCKIGLAWPLEAETLKRFATGLREILVVEEKRPVIETQAKAELFNGEGGLRIVGKKDEHGQALLPIIGETDPLRVAAVIARRLETLGRATGDIRDRLARLLEQAGRGGTLEPESFRRPPHYCSGCPHNTSTVVPEGSFAGAGIGCHIMARLMDRNTLGITQMGGEGAQWVGMAPFTEIPHLFQNLGDGTYFHSGILAIRQAVAANVNITYKILFNDAVAMTGGQSVDGVLTVPDVVRQVAAEGVGRIAVISDDTEKYDGSSFPRDVSIHHRDDLDTVQRELRGVEGVSVLVYDQTCAAEKRRRRKRGRMADPARRVVINDLVCEGCGDCSIKSNCLSVVPVETEFGTKRAIDQSSCNKDFSCVKGFCPSFVTVEGGTLRKPAGNGAGDGFGVLPEPVLPAVSGTYNMVVTGVGGTGVVTIGALLGMAAHIEGRGVSVLDMTGAAQKGGAVFTHVRLSDEPDALHSARIPDGETDLLLGCDIVVTATADVLGRGARERTTAIVNSFETITSEFTRNSNLYRFPRRDLNKRIEAAIGRDNTEFIDAGQLATSILGDSIGVNLFMLGLAWQKGLVPVSHEALDRAIVLNGVAVEFNRQAFLWGRRAAHDRESVERLMRETRPLPDHQRLSETFEEMVTRRAAFLADYQDHAYAARYADMVARMAEAERQLAAGHTGLAESVARNLFKLMAYKDEYEVARLYTGTGFMERLNGLFEGDWSVKVHLAPPLLARTDPATGYPQKRAYGPWMLRAFGVLSRMKGLRGTPFDPFGYTAERRAERRLVKEYETLLADIASRLTGSNHAVAVALAEIPDMIRGYGHVKKASMEQAEKKRAALLGEFNAASRRFEEADPVVSEQRSQAG